MSAGRTYSGWRPERLGIFFGLNGFQVGTVLVAALPPLVAFGRGHWIAAADTLPLTLVLTALVVVPIRRRPAYRWLFDYTLYTIGYLMGWSIWRSKAATGRSAPKDLARADLPGVLSGIQIHDGPPFGALLARVAVIQEPREGLWLATARCVHPGVGGADEQSRDGYAAGLGSLLAAAAESEDVVHVSVLIRTVPDDGAERAAWVRDHAIPNVPDLVATAAEEIEAATIGASVRHEVFVTVGVAEARIRRAAGDAGGGVEGRARVLYRHLAEVEQQLRALGCTDVSWLTTEALAIAIRTGYSPADAAGIVAAQQQQFRGHTTTTGVPMGAAGPSLAPTPSGRRYVHDAATTVSYALLLPKRATYVGSLQRLLTPSVAGERRCLALHYEPYPASRADRQIDRDVWSAEMAVHVKATRGFRVPRRDRKRLDDATRQEEQLTVGHTLVRVAGAAAVTVPSDWTVEDAAARFEASARAAGFGLLRLDLAQDSGFAAAVLPLGIGLPRRGAAA